MMHLLASSLCILFAYFSVPQNAANNAPQSRPNIVFILMDDVGWNDVSFMGSQIPTPNIDALYEDSIFLNKHYIHLMCSPSRSQIITGRYSMYQGFGKMMPWDYTELGGIPVGQPTVANWLKSMGKYATYAVGKWHMGYAYQGLLPGSRGFDHFYGFYQGAIHYDNLKYIDIKYGDSNHFDFWEDGRENRVMDNADPKTMNSMRLYRQKIIENIHDEDRNEDSPFYMFLPLQTIHGPLDEIHEKEPQCKEILPAEATMARHKYCQNMLLTDDIIGDIVTALKESDNWDNTLFIFTSDNGADVGNAGCNYPLRGTKGTLFDGNIRTIALVGGGLIPDEQRGTVRDVLFSSLDWTPTLLDFAGILGDVEGKDRTWDGVSQHDLIMYGLGEDNKNKRRNHIVLNIGLRDLSSSSIVFEMDDILYKYVAENDEIDTWTYKRDDGWCVPDDDNNWAVVLDTEVSLSSHVENKYIFDLTNDVSERTNLLQIEDSNVTSALVKHAKKLMKPYVEHQLYGEHLKFLWIRMPVGDPNLIGEGGFVSPFLTELDYFKHVSRGFSGIEQEFQDAAQEARDNHKRFNEQMPFSKALKGLYFQKWKPPHFNEHVSADDGKQKEGSLLWYIYVIIAVVVVAFIIIVVVSIMKYRQMKNVYKDGYEPIKQQDTKTGVSSGEEENFIAIK